MTAGRCRFPNDADREGDCNADRIGGGDMTLVIGLDTGGTYTDAALVDTADGRVLATGKALTTRDDLSVGVGGAIRRILDIYDGKARRYRTGLAFHDTGDKRRRRRGWRAGLPRHDRL